MDGKLKRKYSPFLLSTWTRTKSEPNFDELEENLPSEIIQKLKKNLKFSSFQNFVNRHVKVQNDKSICKRSLSNLFRAIGNSQIPLEIFGSRQNLNLALKNFNVLFLAGKGTKLNAEDFLKFLDLSQIQWVCCYVQHYGLGQF